MSLQEFINELDAIDKCEFGMVAGQFGLAIDTESGLLEVYLNEDEGDWTSNQLLVAIDILQFNLLRLQNFKTSKHQSGEYDMSVVDDELVFWELDLSDDRYDSRTEERGSLAMAELNNGIAKLLELEPKLGTLSHDWREDGF